MVGIYGLFLMTGDKLGHLLMLKPLVILELLEEMESMVLMAKMV